jgi:hypothetical protein
LRENHIEETLIWTAEKLGRLVLRSIKHDEIMGEEKDGRVDN